MFVSPADPRSPSSPLGLLAFQVFPPIFAARRGNLLQQGSRYHTLFLFWTQDAATSRNMVLLDTLPTPPADYGYLVQLLVALGGISIVVIGIGVRWAVNQGTALFKAYLEEKRQELANARADAEKEKVLAQQRFDASEAKREEKRELMLKELAESTADIIGRVDRIAGSVAGIESRLDAAEKKHADHDKSIQRLEKKGRNPATKE